MWLRELLETMMKSDSEEVGEAFPEMLDLASATFTEVHAALWAGEMTEDLRRKVLDRDARINQIERAVRKDVYEHIVSGDARRMAKCFVLINVVKDAERIGDYVKNLVDPVIDPSVAPQSALVTRVRQMGDETGQLLARVKPVFEAADAEQAEVLLRKGRESAEACGRLMAEIATARMESEATTSLVLVNRFYKRINAHATNILSAIIMPVHQIDYFDEPDLSPDE